MKKEILGGQGSVELKGYLADSEESIVDSARLSWYSQDKASEQSDKKLLVSLQKLGHHSVLEYSFIKFRIVAPVFAARQLVKHRIGVSWTELSRRYVNDDKKAFEFYILENAPEEYKRSIEFFLNTYNSLVAGGMKPKQARGVIPQSALTIWDMTLNLRSLKHLIELRDDQHTQPEIRKVAIAMREIAEELFPIGFSNIVVSVEKPESISKFLFPSSASK